MYGSRTIACAICNHIDRQRIEQVNDAPPLGSFRHRLPGNKIITNAADFCSPALRLLLSCNADQCDLKCSTFHSPKDIGSPDFSAGIIGKQKNG